MIEFGEVIEMTEEEEPVLTEEEAGWKCDSDPAAEWCLKKIREANAEKEKWKAYYANQLKKIEDVEDRRIAFFEAKLKVYFGGIPHKKAKNSESYQLPGGKLVWKHGGIDFDNTKDPAFLKWLEDNKMNDFIKVEKTPKWGDFKKTLLKDEDGNFERIADPDVPGVFRPVTEDGELVPGVVITDKPDEFRVEVK